MFTKIIAFILGITGITLCFVNESLPFSTICIYAFTGILLMLISAVIIIKQHEKSIKYIKMHFVDYAGNHRYIKAYSYVGMLKAIRDMKTKYFELYTYKEVI